MRSPARPFWPRVLELPFLPVAGLAGKLVRARSTVCKAACPVRVDLRRMPKSKIWKAKEAMGAVEKPPARPSWRRIPELHHSRVAGSAGN